MKTFKFRLIIALLLFPGIFFAQNPDQLFKIPSFFKIGEQASIYGNFDADKANTIVVFENENGFFEPEILVETTDKIILNIPKQPAGKYNLFIEDSAINSFIQSPAYLFAVNLSIGKSNLHKREKTQLKIEITGTKNYRNPIAVKITNLSPKKITLPEGNTKIYTLNNGTNKNTLELVVPVKAKKTGTFDIEVWVDNDKFISWDWDKLLKDQIKAFKQLSRDSAENDNLSVEELLAKMLKYRIHDTPLTYAPDTTFAKLKKKYVFTPPVSKKKCLCQLTALEKHKPGNTIYTISRDIKNKSLAKAFYKKGVEFPIEDKDRFKGQDIPIIPGSAYATAYGDVVGGYANAIANAFGKPHPKGTPVPYNFMTNHIGAKAQAMGKHSLQVFPGKDDKSIVIGVAQVQSFAISDAIDPLVFMRKFMKDFDRGREDAEFLNNIYSTFSDPIGVVFSKIRTPIIRKIFRPKADLSLDDKRKHASNTNTNAFATAKVDYIVSVNEHTAYLHQASRSSKKAKIIRKNLKKPRIQTSASSKKLGGLHQAKVTVSASHPSFVDAKILGSNYLSCYAKGNGFADSGIGTKTAVFIVGICVDKNGGKKIKAVYDAGMFVLDNNGKDISKTKTAQIIEAFDKYIDKLQSQVKNKGVTETLNFFKDNVEKDVKRIMDNWMLDYDK